MKPETNWTDKPECFAVGNYYVVPARRWAIAQRQCFDKKGIAHILWHFMIIKRIGVGFYKLLH